jgi:hypothetical protein
MSERETTWLWVSLPYATFGLKIDGGQVVDAPPIAAWALGRDAADVVGYYRRRGADVRPLTAVKVVV